MRITELFQGKYACFIYEHLLYKNIKIGFKSYLLQTPVAVSKPILPLTLSHTFHTFHAAVSSHSPVKMSL